jgi:uncharacterized protein (TIGR00369 family)
MSDRPRVPHTIRDPNFAERVRESFARQIAMSTLGAEFESVTPGRVTACFPYHPRLVQQHGFLHAGVGTAVVDSCCGYSALTLMEPGAAVLAVEFKVQLLAPARGAWFRAVGNVLRPGKTITAVHGTLWAYTSRAACDADTDGELVLNFTGTMMAVRDKPALVD